MSRSVMATAALVTLAGCNVEEYVVRDSSGGDSDTTESETESGNEDEGEETDSGPNTTGETAGHAGGAREPESDKPTVSYRSPAATRKRRSGDKR